MCKQYIELPITKDNYIELIKELKYNFNGKDSHYKPLAKEGISYNEVTVFLSQPDKDFNNTSKMIVGFYIGLLDNTPILVINYDVHYFGRLLKSGETRLDAGERARGRILEEVCPANQTPEERLYVASILSKLEGIIGKYVQEDNYSLPKM